MVGPVLPVVGHLELLDHQNVQMSGALHCMENVEQAVLLTSCSWGEDWTLQQIGVLETDTETKELFNKGLTDGLLILSANIADISVLAFMFACRSLQ